MALTEIEDMFVDAGGNFYTSAFDLREKLPEIKAFVFDWDGVFNAGFKGMENSSNFSEVDSLGVSMMRFGYFLENKLNAKTAIITGESNPACIKWAKREGVNEVYIQSKEKDKALQHFCDLHDLEPSNVAYFFDDVLDVPVAKIAGMRFGVGRDCNPVFKHYLEKHKLVDYLSGCRGDQHAMREFSELVLCLMKKEFDVIDHRAAYDNFYLDYINARQQTDTRLFEYANGSIHPSNEGDGNSGN